MEEAQGKLEIVLKYFDDFSDLQIDRLRQLEPLYRYWNERINVISRKDIDSLYEKHVLHSLALAAVFPFPHETEILDIGTGGGFPGIPLAIFFPECHFHLVDSIGKKISVVKEISASLGLRNLSTYHGRVESLRGKRFDFAVSRAVAPLADLWKWARPLLRNERKMEAYKNGLICLKGGDLTAEVAESRLRPHVTEISSLFREPYFQEKYILYVPL